MKTITALHPFGRISAHGFHPLGWLVQAFAAHHQRMRLEDLDPHMLRDIGLDRDAARREAHRPFWDLP